MRQATAILVLAALQALFAFVLPGPWRAGMLWIAVVTGVVGVAVRVGRTDLLGKRPDGTLPAWSLAAFLPWHLTTRAAAAVVRRLEPQFTEIHPGWYLGGWPHRTALPCTDAAVIDLTCELPRRHRASHYLCLPTWDGTAPRPDDLEAGVRWALTQRSEGRPVLVHCAAGHARSTTVLCAALVAAGLHPTWEDAFAHARRLRPGVRLRPDQIIALRRWSRTRTAA